ncbi:MAG: hypothetical protein RLZZ165_694 [Bacteroidota bacterium]
MSFGVFGEVPVEFLCWRDAMDGFFRQWEAFLTLLLRCPSTARISSKVCPESSGRMKSCGNYH